MTNTKRIGLNVIFLFTFLAVTLFINFLHSEHSLASQEDCPACHFLNSTFTTCQINFFYLPPPSITGVLKYFYSLNYEQIVSVSPSSRSPPEV
ncbi:MAG: hypothetical protein PVH84_07515 [Candidatus Aminicenantes bacterium]